MSTRSVGGMVSYEPRSGAGVRSRIRGDELGPCFGKF